MYKSWGKKGGLNWRQSALCLQLRKKRLQPECICILCTVLLFDVRATTSPTRANS